MGLNEKLDEDLKAAMKAGETLKVSAIRMLKSAVKNAELAKNKKFGDEEIFPVIQTAVKQRKDSAEQFKAGNRPELAEKEEAEIKILSAYLPAQLSEDELKKLITGVISETGASTAKDTGKVMGRLMPLVKGKADGGTVNKLLREILK
jgi:uncharacterized protein